MQLEIAEDELYLAKPAYGGAGVGIRLFKGAEAGFEYSEKENFVLQKFIENPLLISGHRFTMRIYGLIASIEPLKVYLNVDEGIVKFTTEVFDKKNVTSENAVITQVSREDFSFCFFALFDWRTKKTRKIIEKELCMSKCKRSKV